jgi:hypothetical protein
MANTNKINGFSPVQYLSGAAYTGAARTYAIPVSDTTASYAVGDLVRLAGGSDANGIPYVIKIPAAEGQAFVTLGAVVGVSVADAGVSLQAANLDLTTTYIVAATRTVVRYVRVADDPNLLWSASTGATATNTTLAKVGNYNAGLASFYSAADQTYAINQNATVTTLLSPNAPYSNLIVGDGTINTTATLPIRLMGLYQTPDNAVGAYARVLCRFQFHEYAWNVAGTGRTGS